MTTFLAIKNNLLSFFGQLKPSGIEQWLLGAGAALGLFISVAVGGVDRMIYALIVLICVDYASGIIAACRTGQWDSSTGFVGLAKKAVILAVVALCNTVDVAMNTHTLRQMAICAYAVNEAGSIIENIDRAGWGRYIPIFIREALARLREQKGAKK